ncbi:hypothetical protein HDE68_000450 [Pedobacter cryoconitis]|uniref:Lipoprotein n=1 Tax=Pedobacter cryoconitis TaxID=188932 RepID=A0A7W8ZIK8_9SPHI|nr:hypothetical protein [Pedobacter cryoconitis]MBB5634565.1 hypothetical protein [Pedobacter cryoconitis]
MREFYERKKRINQLLPLFLFLLAIFCSSCSKESQEPEPIVKTETDVYAYEVTCTACEIQFLDKNKSIKTVINPNGKWSYPLEKISDAELKLSIKTTNGIYQDISAYILKNNEVIYGDLGYNSFNLLYNIKSEQKSMTYGNYNAGSGGSGSNGGSTKPSSSICGARTKAGGYCKRVVSGGGRCWQHS